MAERLAPERAAPEIRSRPERARGRRRRVLRRFCASLVACTLLLAGTLGAAHFVVIDRSADTLRATGLFVADTPTRALVVLDHPGQELAMAGTLAELEAAGAEVSLLALTAGIAPDSSHVDGEAEQRLADLTESAQRLGVDNVLPMPYPDGQTLMAEPMDAVDQISRAIDAVKPSILLTSADATEGDAGAMAVGSYASTAAQREGSGVTRVWRATRSHHELAWNARLGGQSNFGEAPAAQAAIRIDEQTQVKGALLDLYESIDADSMGSAYHAANTVPAWLYFRFWDREYFSIAFGQPLD
jgi:N-acetylglucosamine malate deacetylase 2